MNTKVFGNHLENLINSEGEVQKIVSAGKDKRQVAEGITQITLIGNPRNIYSILSKDEQENLEAYYKMKLDRILRNQIILSD